MKSIGLMIDQLDAMLGTGDLTSWEEQFVSDLSERTHCGISTQSLSSKQVAAVESIYKKHFGDSE
jgi:hypothetical protein